MASGRADRSNVPTPPVLYTADFCNATLCAHSEPWRQLANNSPNDKNKQSTHRHIWKTPDEVVVTTNLRIISNISTYLYTNCLLIQSYSSQSVYKSQSDVSRIFAKQTAKHWIFVLLFCSAKIFHLWKYWNNVELLCCLLMVIGRYLVVGGGIVNKAYIKR